MIFGINTTCDISKLSQIMHNNFEISLMVFMPNITTNHAITYTNISMHKGCWKQISIYSYKRDEITVLSIEVTYNLLKNW